MEVSEVGYGAWGIGASQWIQVDTPKAHRWVRNWYR
jgi:hypothetical protein